MMNLKKEKSIILILLIACGILAGGLVYTRFTPCLLSSKVQENIITPDQAANLALAYINENLLPPGIEATSTGEVVEEEGLYKFQIKIGNEELFSYVTKDGKILFPQGINLEEEKARLEAEKKSRTSGDFSISEDKVCTENNKPIVYFFGSTGCPHCSWEHPIIEGVAEKFTDFISFHNNMDSSADMDVFSKYSPEGYVPALVLGCKYYRVGSGERMGEEEEAKVLTALICDLTENQPTDVCEKVRDLINQING